MILQGFEALDAWLLNSPPIADQDIRRWGAGLFEPTGELNQLVDHFGPCYRGYKTPQQVDSVVEFLVGEHGDCIALREDGYTLTPQKIMREIDSAIVRAVFEELGTLKRFRMLEGYWYEVHAD